MPCDSIASEPGGGDLRGIFAERLKCARERPFETPLSLRDFCGSQLCIVMHGTATLSVGAS